MISQTYPQACRHEFTLGGYVVQCGHKAGELVTLLLLRSPAGFVSRADCIEWLWPDPDKEPVTSTEIVNVRLWELRCLGVPIENDFAWGWRIPAHERGANPSRLAA